MKRSNYRTTIGADAVEKVFYTGNKWSMQNLMLSSGLKQSNFGQTDNVHKQKGVDDHVSGLETT